jgi:replication initiation and membrane attachment protein DnaB
MPVDIGPFSMMPSKFFGSGTAASIGPSATVLYLALCEHANRHEKNSFTASDRALEADTGIASRTICDARKMLIATGLIRAERVEGRSYTYTLPKQSLQWKRVSDRPRHKRKPRALYSTL